MLFSLLIMMHVIRQLIIIHTHDLQSSVPAEAHCCLQKRTAARKLLMHFGRSDAVAQLSRNLFTGLRPEDSEHLPSICPI